MFAIQTRYLPWTSDQANRKLGLATIVGWMTVSIQGQVLEKNTDQIANECLNEEHCGRDGTSPRRQYTSRSLLVPTVREGIIKLERYPDDSCVFGSSRPVLDVRSRHERAGFARRPKPPGDAVTRSGLTRKRLCHTHCDPLC